QKTQQLEELASTDPLTGIFNRRHFLDLADREVKRARRYRRPLAALYLDLNGLRALNDSHSQAAGDTVLQAVAVRLQGTVRDIDLLGRIGEDEFAALRIEGDQAAADYVAARCERSLADTPIATMAGPLSITASVACVAMA